MTIPARKLQPAVAHVRSADPVLGEVIDRVGPVTLKLERDRFRMLVRSIISQQISTKAARAIRGRLEAAVGPEGVTPESLARLKLRKLRKAGLSAQKAGYLLDLVEKLHSGRLRLRQIGRLSDARIIEELTQVRGIGRWTAQMFLIFSLGRLDVFPHDDLGIRVALKHLYDLDDLPDKATSHEIADPWRPYATVASWYCWRSLDLAKDEDTFAAEYPS